MCSKIIPGSTIFSSFPTTSADVNLSPFQLNSSLFKTNSSNLAIASSSTIECPLSPTSPLVVEQLLKTPRSVKMTAPFAPRSKNTSSRRLNFMSADQTELTSSPSNKNAAKSPACRNLFSTSSSAESKDAWRSWMQQYNVEKLQAAKRKYNFDFEKFKPVAESNQNGSAKTYEWSQVEIPSELPTFYTADRHSSNSSITSEDFKKMVEIGKLQLADNEMEECESVSTASTSSNCSVFEVPQYQTSTPMKINLGSIPESTATRSASKSSTVKRSQQLLRTPFKMTPAKKSETPKQRSSMSTRKRTIGNSSTKKNSNESPRQPEITDYIPACKKSRTQVKRKL